MNTPSTPKSDTCFTKAKGALLTDINGQSWIDFTGSRGSMILGYGAAAITRVVKQRFTDGLTGRIRNEAETQLASLIKKALPSIDQLRFTSSGTEAVMSALRLARAVTKRDRLLKFEGSYHGYSDGVLVKAGSGVTTFGVPAGAGIQEALARFSWVLPYGDLDAVEDVFRTQGVNIAAVIVEPVCSHMGVVAPPKGFLEKLRELSTKYETLLIFDEVTTGFRLAWDGAQGYFGVTPDLTCLGGIIGGGFPVGAFGGRQGLMDQLASAGPVFQDESICSHPVTMAAGLATLKTLEDKKPHKKLASRTKSLVSFLRSEAARLKVPVQINQMGSQFSIHFTGQAVTSWLTAEQSDSNKYATFHAALLQKGVLMPAAPLGSAFVSTAHNPAIMETAKKAFSAAFEAVGNAS